MRFLRRLLFGYDYRFEKGWFIDQKHVVAAHRVKSGVLVYLSNGLVIKHDDWEAAVTKGLQLK